MQQTMEKQREMLFNAIQQNTQICVQTAEMMEANREYRRKSIRPAATSTTMIDMTYWQQYCGGATELNNVLDKVWSNCQSHTHLLLHGNSNTLTYAVSLRSTWNIHPDPAQWQRQMTDLVVWLWDLQRDSDLCLDDFEVFLAKIQKMYGNKDRKLNMAMKCMTYFLQGANEPVRANTNRMKANRRAVGWLLPDEKNHYEIACSGQQPGLKP